MNKSVYVMTRIDGAVKIGISFDPATRAEYLDARLVFATILTEYARKVEMTTHQHFLANRIEGEWFSVSAKDAVAAVEGAMVAVIQGRITEFRGLSYLDGGTPRVTLGLRLEPDELAALRKAAAAGEWSISFTARKAIVDWLVKNGWLKDC